MKERCFHYALLGSLVALWWFLPKQGYQLSGIALLLPLAILAILSMSMFFIVEYLHQRWQHKRRRQRLQKHLARLSMSLEEALESAPYTYAHWQGEDGYRIFTTQAPYEIVGYALTEFEAWLWIVEHHPALSSLGDKKTGPH